MNKRQDDMRKRQYDLYGGTLPTFEDRILSRNTDPDTSHLAEKKLKESGKLSEWCYRVLAARPKEETASEIAARMGIGEQAHKRLPDLRAKALVENGEKRQCRITGATCITWSISERGERRLG